MNDTVAIAPLTKVTLHIKTHVEKDTSSKPASPIAFDFVFGLATQGLTDFEKALINKVPGDRLHIHVKPSQAHLFFDYLAGPLTQALGAAPTVEMEVQVAGVSPVSDRELVHALAGKAASAGCGCEGDGGCGCEGDGGCGCEDGGGCGC
jgi:hypothetical protein